MKQSVTPSQSLNQMTIIQNNSIINVSEVAIEISNDYSVIIFNDMNISNV
jgi:hypothetical protein